MKKRIDCFLIGHNEMNFREYEANIRNMGKNSGAFRDLNLNYIRYNNQPYTVAEVYNLFCASDGRLDCHGRYLREGETFSAAIAYLGTYLSRRGLTFDFVNSFTAEQEKLAEQLEQEEILTAAIITTLYVAAFPILEIVDFIRKHNERVKIIVGGPFIATQVRSLDPPELDYLFRTLGADFYVNSSQGEAALVKLVQALKQDKPPHQIENIYFRETDKGDAGYVQTPTAPEDNKLQENMVDWRMFPGRVGEFANIRTSISCPFSCSFCGFPEHAGRYQTTTVEEIEKELNLLCRNHGVKSINFIDDTFNIPVKRFKEILRMMIKNKYPFKWHSHFRAQYADREMLELMKASGCEGVFLGIESGSDRILENMNKKVTVGKYTEGIALLKEYEILTYGSFIIGFPGETLETVQDSIAFIKESGIDFFRAQLWYCDPITPIWRQREKYHIKGSQFEWEHLTMKSDQACDLIDDIFLTIDKPVWVPQYNFEFDGTFRLFNKGITPGQLKNFLNAFNRAVKDKLGQGEQASFCRKEVSGEMVEQIKSAFGEIASAKPALNLDDRYGVQFDF
jgi:anaerobic magnesium-protoporphyrin IX monomethyl ester cyclase